MLIRCQYSSKSLVVITLLGIQQFFGFINGVSVGITSDNKVSRINECNGEDLKRLQSIRALFKNENFTLSSTPISAYIVPMADAHNSEYIGEHDKRIQFLTKFTGSNGMVVITETKAALWTDSRYHLQAERELNTNCWIVMKSGNEGVPTVSQWINENISKGLIGVNPFVFSTSSYHEMKKSLSQSSNTLRSVRKDLVDAIWDNRPRLPTNEIYPLSLKFTGQPASEKISIIRKKIKENKAGSIIISALDDIAWLLNLRGSDIKYTPVFFGYIILTMDELILFVNNKRMFSNVLRSHFRNEDILVKIRLYDEILEGVSNLVKCFKERIIVSKNVNEAIFERIPTEQVLEVDSIVAQIKAIKNKIEAENLRKAHIRDGLALIRFLHWLESSIDKVKISEISAATKLNEFRRQEENFKDLSFQTISAFGSHASMAHYSPSPQTDIPITKNELYLVDSGGQYLDGTTDVTRTIHLGEPTAYEKECFTRVLKGFIALVTSIFPENTPLNYFDRLARQYLWQVGLNYGHGTGHGVGAFLNVHEYPPLISSAGGNNPGMLENMFTSNEPGYYKEEQFGIRLEDVIQVIKSDVQKGFLKFETITFAPIQIKMIDKKLLTNDEVNYLNEYHKSIVNTIGPLLLQRNLNETYQWLVKETEPINIMGRC